MANEISFEQFCDVLEKIYNKKGNRPEQERILSDFITEIKSNAASNNQDGNLYPVLRLLLPDLERERSAYNLKEKKLGQLLRKVLGLHPSSNYANKLLNYRGVGKCDGGNDFASVASTVIRNTLGNKDTKCTLTIRDVNEKLDQISEGDTENNILFTTIVKSTNPTQAKWFFRIVLKELRLGLGRAAALACLHCDAPEYYDNCSDLAKLCEELDEGSSRPLEQGVRLFTHVCPMSSERLDITRIEATLRPDRTYHMEEKFDGERFQIHMKDGQFNYLSRRGFSFADKYGKTYDSGLFTPQLKDCFKAGVDSFILDGEMMGWHIERERFGAKAMYDVKKLKENSKYRPCFFAFDLLYYNGTSLVGAPEQGGRPLRERLDLLDNMFTDLSGVIMHSRRKMVVNSSHVLEALNQAIEDEEEGLVVKDTGSYYIANKRNAGWYKIKPEYTEGATTDLDLVVIGAKYAANKSHGLAKSFFVACVDRDPGSPPRRWLSVCSVSSGLTLEEKERICKQLSPHWKKASEVPVPECLVFGRERPDLWVMPEHSTVFTVRATELVLSRDSGTAHTLRFPRVQRLRDDKPRGDVITLADINQLVSNKGAVMKLSTHKIDQSEIEVGAAKAPRKRKANPLQVAEQFKTISKEVEVTSGALKGRKICVLSDDEECSKKDLEEIVLRHAGSVVQNPSPTTWCCVYGTLNFRVRNLIKSQQYDIVHSSWLRTLPPSDRPCPSPAPLHLVAMCSETRVRLARDYDVYGDSYTEDVDEETLRRCFDKMDSDPPIHLTTEEMIELDNELFEGTNPYSFLRPCFIHTKDCRSLAAIKAQIFGASLCKIQSPNLTHIVLNEDEVNNCDLESIKNDTKAFVVSTDWLEECFERREMVAELEYAL
ncbi:DNA ligase 4 [Plutella xylostella]|uniref:DNA ligase 4 n=1 Tax=Plutella xylostella TaxID=51655 RepID=UPI00203287AE|nr:DNA ligase 4 [Plutella xylostella]